MGIECRKQADSTSKQGFHRPLRLKLFLEGPAKLMEYSALFKAGWWLGGEWETKYSLRVVKVFDFPWCGMAITAIAAAAFLGQVIDSSQLVF